MLKGRQVTVAQVLDADRAGQLESLLAADHRATLARGGSVARLEARTEPDGTALWEQF
jgi:hypothetical protein